MQTLNLPGADRPGSAGRPLPHARVRVAADGEIEIAGSLFAGYLGEAARRRTGGPPATSARIDADGFLHVRGRKKHVLITAFGRNVRPNGSRRRCAASPRRAGRGVRRRRSRR